MFDDLAEAGKMLLGQTGDGGIPGHRIGVPSTGSGQASGSLYFGGKVLVMRAMISGVLLVLGAMFAVAPGGAESRKAPVQVVPAVDLTRYVGKWYEIARLPAWFQRDCTGDTTATYTLRPEGRITVVNECRKADGRMKSAKGVAKLASKTGLNSKLKVTFFWPFYGDYWILDLDPEYRWAVVGEPRRKYLWILSRQPELDQAVYEQIVERAAKQGYDVSRLMVTRHGR